MKRRPHAPAPAPAPAPGDTRQQLGRAVCENDTNVPGFIDFESETILVARTRRQRRVDKEIENSVRLFGFVLFEFCWFFFVNKKNLFSLALAQSVHFMDPFSPQRNLVIIALR